MKTLVRNVVVIILLALLISMYNIAHFMFFDKFRMDLSQMLIGAIVLFRYRKVYRWLYGDN